MRTRTNLIVLGVAAALVAAGSFYFWQQRQAAEAEARAAVRQETVGRGAIVATVSATGSVVPEAQVNLFFRTAQPLRVAEVNVAFGQAVRRGDRLARLDPADLELAVQQADQALRVAETGLAQLEAPARAEDLAVAEAGLRVARAQLFAASGGPISETVQMAYLNLLMAQNALNQTYRAMDQLVAQGRFAEKNNLQAQADRQVQEAQIADERYKAAKSPAGFANAASAQAAIAQAEAQLTRLKEGAGPEDLEIARLQVDQARAALELARSHLAQAELVAPFDAVVAAVNLRLGEPASSAVPAVVLADVARFHLDVAVDEVDVARVAVGQRVTVTVDALPGELLAGSVETIASTATTRQGVVSYPVRIALPEPPAALRGGMTVTAEIVVEEVRDVVLAPNWAIRRDRDTGQAFASVLRGGRLEEVEVTLGLRDESFSEVRSGLQAGDVVAVSTDAQGFSLFGGGGE